MEEKELMIGDWVNVYINDDDPMECGYVTCKIDSINEFGDISAYFDDRKEEDIEPIPLTVDILKKNGLEASITGQHWKEDEDFLLEISVEDGEIWWSINFNEYSIMRLYYVHQLQHAMRLCNIKREIIL